MSMEAAPRSGVVANWMPQIVLTPTLISTFVYVFLFCGWTIWISLSKSTLLPNYEWLGFDHYVSLWSSRRWIVAFTNLFLFGALYVFFSMLIGLILAILIDQRVKGENVFRTIFLYPLAVSFVVTGVVWRWILNPQSGLENLMQDLGWVSFTFGWIVDRDLAIYTIVMAGVWHAAGFAMALFLAGLRAVDQDLVKAAQIDGAGVGRIYRRIVLPSIRPIFVAVMVILLQFAIKTFDLVLALTTGGPGISTTVPAIYVYDLMFQRGQMGEGAAAAIMILLALACVLIPYGLYQSWRARQEVARG
ncbi:MAG: sugar ABC transporter permease [Geminicoccaceae bacterium]|nr:sugar ABC transporter permease [Geminicoccaceae bacterium]